MAARSTFFRSDGHDGPEKRSKTFWENEVDLPNREYLEHIREDAISALLAGLFLASANGRVKAMEALIEHCLDLVNHRGPGGWTALHVASAHGQSEACKCLLSRGAVISLKGHNGMGVLHLAAMSGDAATCNVLLDKYGAQPLHVASRPGSKDVASADAATRRRWTPLHVAAVTGQVRVVDELLKLGACVEERDCDGETIAHIAAWLDHLSIVEYLVTHYPSVLHTKNNAGLRPIDVAPPWGHCARMLGGSAVIPEQQYITFHVSKHDLPNREYLEHIREDGTPALLAGLFLASANGRVEAMEAVIEHCLDLVNHRGPGGWTALHVASAHGQSEACKCLLSRGAVISLKGHNGMGVLHLAAMSGDAATCNVLLASGAVVAARDQYGAQPLHFAATSGNGDIFALLLSHGAYLCSSTKSGWTATHIAVEFGHFERLLSLSPRGSNLSSAATHRFWTPLHVAAVTGQVRVVDELLKLGACVEERDCDGETIAHIAAWLDHLPIVEYLVTHYPSVLHTKNNAGLRPIDVAPPWGHCARMLIALDLGEVVTTTATTLALGTLDDSVECAESDSTNASFSRTVDDFVSRIQSAPADVARNIVDEFERVTHKVASTHVAQSANHDSSSKLINTVASRCKPDSDIEELGIKTDATIAGTFGDAQKDSVFSLSVFGWIPNAGSCGVQNVVARLCNREMAFCSFRCKLSFIFSDFDGCDFPRLSPADKLDDTAILPASLITGIALHSKTENESISHVSALSVCGLVDSATTQHDVEHAHLSVDKDELSERLLLFSSNRCGCLLRRIPTASVKFSQDDETGLFYHICVFLNKFDVDDARTIAREFNVADAVEIISDSKCPPAFTVVCCPVSLAAASADSTGEIAFNIAHQEVTRILRNSGCSSTQILFTRHDSRKIETCDADPTLLFNSVMHMRVCVPIDHVEDITTRVLEVARALNLDSRGTRHGLVLSVAPLVERVLCKLPEPEHGRLRLHGPSALHGGPAGSPFIYNATISQRFSGGRLGSKKAELCEKRHPVTEAVDDGKTKCSSLGCYLQLGRDDNCVVVAVSCGHDRLEGTSYSVTLEDSRLLKETPGVAVNQVMVSNPASPSLIFGTYAFNHRAVPSSVARTVPALGRTTIPQETIKSIADYSLFDIPPRTITNREPQPHLSCSLEVESMPGGAVCLPPTDDYMGSVEFNGDNDRGSGGGGGRLLDVVGFAERHFMVLHDRLRIQIPAVQVTYIARAVAGMMAPEPGDSGGPVWIRTAGGKVLHSFVSAEVSLVSDPREIFYTLTPAHFVLDSVREWQRLHHPELEESQCFVRFR